MTQRYYAFAGLEFQVEMPSELWHREERHLAPFRVEQVTDPHRFLFRLVPELQIPEGKPLTEQPGFRVYAQDGGHVRTIGSGEPYVCVVHKGKWHHVSALERMFGTIGAKTVLDCMEAEHLIARNNGFVFHCSYIAHNGKAILFTAPSGTGKSTQAELWQQYRGAEIINGDRAAVRLADGVLLAEGIPFAGSSQYCKNRSLPIAAIVYLGQAPKTSIRKLRGYEAFARIWEGISVNTWDREDVDRISAVVQRAAARIPVFHLPCTPDESAVIALEEAMRKQDCL